jgi:hypothetical protein
VRRIDERDAARWADDGHTGWADDHYTELHTE